MLIAQDSGADLQSSPGVGLAFRVASALPLENGQVPTDVSCLSMVAAEDVLKGVEGPPVALFGFGEAPAVLVEGAEVATNLGDIKVQRAEVLLTEAESLQ
jgi:hypothetical protein